MFSVSKLFPISVVVVLAGAAALSGCGSQGISSKVSAQHRAGAQLFSERCSGCHTLAAAGTQGSGTAFDKERTDGPNLNTRKETQDAVLYAIRNGGFSGAIMPKNLVVGNDADQVAAFVAEYAGREAKVTLSPKTLK